jgi:hypothetical protein
VCTCHAISTLQRIGKGFLFPLLIPPSPILSFVFLSQLFLSHFSHFFISVGRSLEEVKKRYKSGIPELGTPILLSSDPLSTIHLSLSLSFSHSHILCEDPVEDMLIDDKEFVKVVRRLEVFLLSSTISLFSCLFLDLSLFLFFNHHFFKQ